MATLDTLLRSAGSLPDVGTSALGFKGLAVGVLYSLHRAQELGFVARVGQAVGPDYSTELDAAIIAIQSGRAMPVTWSAGFYFNSALVRIAAGAHRALRVLYRTDKGWFAELADKAVRDGRVKESEINLLRDTYHDVNAFKHDGHGELLVNRKIESLEQGIASAEQLIRLIEKAV